MNEKKFITKTKFTFIFIMMLILIDQVTKIIVILATNKGQVEIVKGVLNFTYLQNTGGAFSIGSNNTMFILLNIFVIFLLIKFIISQRKIIDVKMSLALSLVISGGISNLIDRSFRGGVVDFIDFSPIINFPEFNLADIFIVIGWILIAFCVAIVTGNELKERKDKISFLKKKQRLVKVDEKNINSTEKDIKEKKNYKKESE